MLSARMALGTAKGFARPTRLVVKVAGHVLVNGRVSLVHELLEVISDELLHLLGRQVGGHDAFLRRAARLSSTLTLDAAASGRRFCG
jgi:hypothetical protein